MMAAREEDEEDADGWAKIASNSHQNSREAREAAREAEREEEMRRIERLEAAEEARALAERTKAWERTNHVMDFTRRVLLDDITHAANETIEETLANMSDEESTPTVIDASGRPMYLAQQEAGASQGSTEDADTRPQINVERQGDGSFEDECSVEPPDPEKSGLLQDYSKSNNSQQLLLAMSFGLKSKDGTRLLGDFVNDPLYVSMANKSSFHPTVPMLKAEMKRRARARGFTRFKKNSALKPECLQWLKANPVVNIHDIAFLRREEGKTYDSLRDMQEEREREEVEKRDRSNWTTIHPWLRLYHCMVSDDAKEALANLGKVLNKNELQNRNDEERPRDYYEVIRDEYNDEGNVIVSEAMPSLHVLFIEPITLRFSQMPGGELSTEDVKRKVTEAKARTLQVSDTASVTRKDVASCSFSTFAAYEARTSFYTQRSLPNGSPAVTDLDSGLSRMHHSATGLLNT
ncbi:MAG: hypothetical protein SGARI_003087, partial [Bacillariaceae sp.]